MEREGRASARPPGVGEPRRQSLPTPLRRPLTLQHPLELGSARRWGAFAGCSGGVSLPSEPSNVTIRDLMKCTPRARRDGTDTSGAARTPVSASSAEALEASNPRVAAADAAEAPAARRLHGGGGC